MDNYLYTVTQYPEQEDGWSILHFDAGDFESMRRVQKGDRLQFLNAVKSMTDTYIAHLVVSGAWEQETL